MVSRQDFLMHERMLNNPRVTMPTRFSEQQALLKRGYTLPDIAAEAGSLIKPVTPFKEPIAFNPIRSAPGANGPAIKPDFDFKPLLLIGGIILALVLIFGRK